MKRLKKTILILGCIVALLTGAYFIFFYQSPKGRLVSVTQYTFSMSIDQLNPKITSFKEQWCLNGDGECLIEFDLRGQAKSFVDKYAGQFSPLPVKENIILPIEYGEMKDACYAIKFDPKDDRNYGILMIDTLANKGLFYYCIF